MNVFIFALALGIGRARGRFESILSDANEPGGMGQFKPGKRTAAAGSQGTSRHQIFLHYILLTIFSRHRPLHFWVSVCCKHHYAGTSGTGSGSSLRAPFSKPCSNPINAFLTLAAVTGRRRAEPGFAGGRGTREIPWQPSKFHVENRVCGWGGAESAIAPRGDCSLRKTPQGAGI